MNRIAIVGAGWSGLAAAVELVAAGHPVTVFESARTPGGRARSVDLDGITLDNGQHLLSGAYSETLALMRRVGVDPEAVLRRLPLSVLVPGRFTMKLPRLPAPLNLGVGLLAARGPSMVEKFRAADFVRHLKNDDFRLARDIAVSNWLDAHNQHGCLRHHLWEPLCVAALNTPPDSASAQVFANVLRDTLGGNRAATDLLIPRVDLGRLLPEPAANFIARGGGSLRLSARVRAIVPGEPGFAVHGDGWSEHFDQIVVACAPQHVRALLPASPALAPIAGMLAGLGYEPIGTVYVQYPKPIALPMPMIALARGLGQWVFDRGRIDGESTLFAHVLSASGRWEKLSDEELAAALHRELVAAIGDLPQPLGHLTIRERRATFSCRPNLARPPVATALPGFWMAGDYTAGDYPATIEGAVRSGLAAARGVLAGR